MDISTYIKEMKEIYKEIHDFICNPNSSEVQFQEIVKLFTKSNLKENNNKLREIIHIINDISHSHHRTATFYNKIDQIIQHLAEDIKQSFSNSDIYNIIENNRRLLLSFIENNIITVNKTIATEFFEDDNYYKYFNLEIQRAFNSKIDLTIDQNYEQNRHNGENESKICQIIRNDSLDEFISLHQKSDISINDSIDDSIFETNNISLTSFDDISLIHYATFYGSIKIIKYLMSQNVELPSNIWLYAVRSNNTEIFQLLKEKNVEIKNLADDFVGFDEIDPYELLITESIKCHHNEMTNYIKKKFNS